MFEIGQILENKYKITEHIGTGGGGIVYKATQTGLNRTVAIKQIKENVSGVLKDRGEADILKNLKNNYIPSVFDFIESDGEVYTVMEFVEGKSFQQLIDSGKRFSRQKLLKYARQLCEAVSYLHSRRPPVIHSDIKPANIMLTPDDNICLIDYNISLIIDGSENAVGVSDGYSPPEQYGKAFCIAKNGNSVTMSAENASVEETLIDGTELSGLSDDVTLIDPAAMASAMGRTLIDSSVKDGYTKTVIQKTNAANNEAFSCSGTKIEHSAAAEGVSVGIDRKVDKRSDIYSIGASIYGIALGERPAVSTGKVEALKDKNSGLSESFAAIIDKAMEKNPAKRFGSAEQMLKALNNIRRYDRRYKKMVIRQEIAAFTVIAAMAAACLTAVMGYMRLGDEDIIRYDQLISEMDSSEITEAEKYCIEAAEIFPERAEAYEKMALLIYESGNYASAAEYIEKVSVADNGQTQKFYDWFPEKLYNKDSVNYILDNSWCKPRDIVRLLIAAQNDSLHCCDTIFTQAAFDSLRKEYSKNSLTEIRQELQSLYTMEEIEMIIKLLRGGYAITTPEQIRKSATKGSKARQFWDERNEYILEDLYRIGFWGNVNRAGSHYLWRWNHKGDTGVLIKDNWELAIHPALYTELSLQY